MKKIGILLIVLALVGFNTVKSQPVKFREISPKEIEGNVVKLFQDDWFLLTAV